MASFWTELLEGISSTVAERLRRFWNDDKAQAREQLQRGSERIALPVTGYNMWSEYGYSTTEAFLRQENDVLTRYSEYDAMESYGDLSCLSGMLRVPVVETTERLSAFRDDFGVSAPPLSWLAEEWEAGRLGDLQVYAMDLRTRRVVVTPARYPRKTGERRPVFRVTYEEFRRDRQWSLVCTEDHLFMRRDGSYTRAVDLRPGDRLMPFTCEVLNGYSAVRDPLSGQAVSLHRLIAAGRAGRPLRRSEEVHHRDGDKGNLAALNLAVVSSKEHRRRHQEDFPAEEAHRRQKIAESVRQQWADPEYRNRLSAAHRGTGAWLASEKEGRYKKPKRNLLSEAHCRAISEGRTIPLARDVVEAALRASPTLKAAAARIGVSAPTLRRRVDAFGLDLSMLGSSLVGPCPGSPGYTNHRVVSVEFIGYEDVYDLEVPERHNFAVGGAELGRGYVFVHNSVLDTYADNATQPDTQRRKMVWPTSKNKAVLKTLEELFYKTLRIDEDVQEIARATCKLGNSFEELIVDDSGVIGLQHLPAASMRRIEDCHGHLDGFIQDIRGRVGYTLEEYRQLLSARDAGCNARVMGPDKEFITVFRPWEVVHFRLRLKSRRSVYGISVLDAARAAWKRLMLLEDAAVLHQIQRAQDRLVFYVDIGDLPPREVEAALRKYRHQLNKKRFVDPKTNQLSLKFDPLPVAHDTPIPLLDGRTIPISQMAEEHAQGKELWVYSIDQATGSLVPGKAVWVGKTRENAPAVKVTFDDGGYATMAPDHPVMLRDCTYKQAGKLKKGDSVMPFYRRVSSKKKGAVLEGYELVYDPAKKRSVYTHRQVGRVLGFSRKGEILHHRNFNPRDNTPANLESMTQSEHATLHAKAGHIGGQVIIRLRKERPDLDARMRRAARKTIIEYNQSDAHRAATRAFNARRDYSVMAETLRGSEAHKAANSVRQTTMQRAWSETEKREAWALKMRLVFPEEFVQGVAAWVRAGCGAEEVVRRVNASDLLGVFQRANPSRQVKSVHRHLLLKLYRDQGFEDFAAFRTAVCGAENHRVVSVEEVASCDHYCMTVEHWHNFSLCLRDQKTSEILTDSGIVTRNSSEDHIFIPTRRGSDGSRVESLPAHGWPSTEVMEFMLNRLYAAVKMPRAYLSQPDTIQKAPLSTQDVQFARTVLRIQQELRNGLSMVARIHLMARNVDPRTVEFEINMAVPSAIYELAQMEVNNARADFATRMDGFVSRKWLLSKVFALADEEVEKIFLERREDTVRAAEDQAYAEAAAQAVFPPPEEAVEAAKTASARPPMASLLSSALTLPERPTRKWSEQELLAGNREVEKRMEGKLDKLLREDRQLAYRLSNLSQLIGDIRNSYGRSRGYSPSST